MAQKTSDPNASIAILFAVSLLWQQTRRLNLKGGSFLRFQIRKKAKERLRTVARSREFLTGIREGRWSNGRLRVL